MTFKNFVCKGILVFVGLLLLGWIGKYIYIVTGSDLCWYTECQWESHICLL